MTPTLVICGCFD